MKDYNYNKYTALIGDIIDSKKIKDRSSIQNKLRNILSEINKKYENDISSQFMITLGDEFQGLLKSPSNIIDIIEKIERELYPVTIRFGIGIGKVDTRIVLETPFGMDGPAYHNARNMLQTIRGNEKKRMISKTDIMLEISDNKEYSTLINTVFSLVYNIKKKWTVPQKDAIYEYEKCGQNQERAAKQLGITQSAVYKRLNSANYYTYADAMTNIEKTLDTLFEEI